MGYVVALLKMLEFRDRENGDLKEKKQTVPSTPPASMEQEPDVPSTLPNIYTNPMAEIDDTTETDPKEKSWREKTMRELVQSRREERKKEEMNRRMRCGIQ